MPQPSLKTIQRFVEGARALWEREGEIEIDDMPGDLKTAQNMISATDDFRQNGGMYVKAWVWVYVDEAAKEKDLNDERKTTDTTKRRTRRGKSAYSQGRA